MTDRQPTASQSARSPYTVRPLGSTAWAADVGTLEQAVQLQREARDRGLRLVVIVDRHGEIYHHEDL